MEPWETTIAYHQVTKHHYHRSAPSLGYMDWATQPDPFRRFDPVPGVRLRLPDTDRSPPYSDLYAPDRLAPRPVDADSLSEFLESALAVSAWKEYQGTRWALRSNPSSGNLHPTEGYLVLGPVQGLCDTPGVHHYGAREHGLQLRCPFAPELWESLMCRFPPGTFLVGLSSIHWREAWKYGERAYRYCQHDLGHAMGSCALAAQSLGWRTTFLQELPDADAAQLLGIDREEDFRDAEQEAPGLFLAVTPGLLPQACARDLPTEIIGRIAAGHWQGRANCLSQSHVDWEGIAAVSEACIKSRNASNPSSLPMAEGVTALSAPPVSASAREVIRQRRSAVALDGKTGLSREWFYAMMQRVLPRAGSWPWETLGSPVATHLALFVHRVQDIPPGLYCLARSPTAIEALRGAMHDRFRWERPPGCPSDLPLFLLESGDVRGLATQVSCGQAIAGDGAYSLGMIVRFKESLREHGSWFYRRLFWETGLLGQVLYLEAEAAGIRATGIGCFFDDPVHEAFGLHGDAFQSLYHFTMGGPVEDARLTTLPAYDHGWRDAEAPDIPS